MNPYVFTPAKVSVFDSEGNEVSIGYATDLQLVTKKSFRQKVRKLADKILNKFGYEKKSKMVFEGSFSMKMSKKQIRKLKRAVSDIQPL